MSSTNLWSSTMIALLFALLVAVRLGRRQEPLLAFDKGIKLRFNYTEKIRNNCMKVCYFVWLLLADFFYKWTNNCIFVHVRWQFFSVAFLIGWTPEAASSNLESKIYSMFRTETRNVLLLCSCMVDCCLAWTNYRLFVHIGRQFFSRFSHQVDSCSGLKPF
jgi:hypothetical protein